MSNQQFQMKTGSKWFYNTINLGNGSHPVSTSWDAEMKYGLLPELEPYRRAQSDAGREINTIS